MKTFTLSFPIIFVWQRTAGLSGHQKMSSSSLREQMGGANGHYFLMNPDEVAICPFQSTTLGDISTGDPLAMFYKRNLRFLHIAVLKGSFLPFSTGPLTNRIISDEFRLGFDFAFGCT